MEKESCLCRAGENIVITCSGAADVGYVADQAARKLSHNNISKMSCLVLFAICENEKINEFKNKNILVIDGCSEDCGKKIMQQRGIKDNYYLRVTDLGYEKGKTLTSLDTIENVYEKAKVYF